MIALPRQPGLLGRIQAEYQAALDAAERPRADNRAQESRFKSVALEVYKAVPTWGPEVKHLRQACRRVQDLAGELHKAEEALGAVPPRKKGPWVKKREELEARVDALQTELAEARKASDVSRTIISETFTRIVGQMISEIFVRTGAQPQRQLLPLGRLAARGPGLPDEADGGAGAAEGGGSGGVGRGARAGGEHALPAARAADPCEEGRTRLLEAAEQAAEGAARGEEGDGRERPGGGQSGDGGLPHRSVPGAESGPGGEEQGAGGAQGGGRPGGHDGLVGTQAHAAAHPRCLLRRGPESSCAPRPPCTQLFLFAHLHSFCTAALRLALPSHLLA